MKTRKYASTVCGLCGFLVVIYIVTSNNKMILSSVNTFTFRSGGAPQSEGPWYVIIFAGERTGSSFTGELFNQNPEAFYFYEPLHFMARTMHYPRPLDNTEYNLVISQILENVLMCNFPALPSEVLKDKATPRSRSFVEYKKCLQEDSVNCQSLIRKKCMSQNIRVLKTVRSTMEAVLLLIRRNHTDINNLRVIHLLRDPHGQMLSKSLYPHKSAKIDFDKTRQVCERHEKDVLLQRRLRAMYPHSFLELHYEELAYSPLETADKIYKFINGNLAPEVVKNWLQDNTQYSDTSVSGSRYGTSRTDSASTADAWRAVLASRKDWAGTIDKACDSYFKTSNYYKAFNI